MTDRPIIFSGPMVLGLLREINQHGTGKTMTRRLDSSPLAKAVPGAAMEGRAGAHAREPHKDSQHAWSARKVAGQMEEWFIHNREAPGAKNRVNTGPEEPEAS